MGLGQGFPVSGGVREVLWSSAIGILVSLSTSVGSCFRLEFLDDGLGASMNSRR